MSLLTPLYVLGLLAVSLPVVFHLIRRQPHGEFAFSSLMFLSPSPPRLARRSRIQHILLLVLRGLALALLALAFARPFLRSEAALPPSDADARRVAIVVDTSASMRRGDLWQQATAAVDQIMADARPSDQFALLACDDALRPLITFEDMAQLEPAQRRATVQSLLKAEQPTWAGTQLGQGLMDAVEIVSSVSESRGPQTHIARRIVLVSDLQEGGRLNALADYPWPEDVELELRPLSTLQKTNAGVHYVADAAHDESPAADRDFRVRVSNDANSTADEFQITWLDAADKPIGSPVPVYVPPGESRIARLPRPAATAATRLRLSGDHFDFDNTLYLASRESPATNVLYIGDDPPNDPQKLRYYLERALTEGSSHPINLVTPTSDKPLPLESSEATPFVVITNPPSEEQLRQLKIYVNAGGSILVVLQEPKQAAALATLLGQPSIEAEETKPSGYAMLGQIDFTHPLFAPMSGPHFNDFTQIHFWKYRRLKPDQLGDAKLVARFENGDAALVEWRRGKGRVYALTSGWHPADSQFARSWKFVLFVAALVRESGGEKTDRTYFAVNEAVPVEPSPSGRGQVARDSPRRGEGALVIKPSGDKVSLAADARTFTETDLPGIYTLGTGTNAPKFAVNLDPLESKTAALSAESLEQLGCRLVRPNAVAEKNRRQQQVQDVQIESRQKLWQWLIVAALAVLVVETWLAGRLSKPANMEVSPA